ncbi:MAG: hypothetical protein QOI92_1521 [Chloroflexota bacterium]|nr:hypothetical protein [Chloroflexota bacterium]
MRNAERPASLGRLNADPPRSPRVITSVAPGRTSGTTSPGRALGTRSSALTTTRFARVRSGPATGARRSTSRPVATSRRRPCQPRATRGAGAPSPSTPQVPSSSPATGASTNASNPEVQARGRSVSAMGAAADRQRWRRPVGVSMFSNTGPWSSATRVTIAPAASSVASSSAVDAAESTPTSDQTSRPRRASVSEA